MILTNPNQRNRRRFLAQMALLATAPLLRGVQRPGTAAESAAVSTRFPLSTSSIQFKDLPLEQACERIAALGFDAIDIWSGYENCPHLDDAARRLGGDGLKELLAKHGLKLYSFSTYVGGYGRYAALLGKTGGGVAVQGSTAPCRPEELSSRMKAFLDSLKPLVALAEKHNSYLAIENHVDSLLDSLDSFKAFTDLNQSPRLGIALAPYHLQAIGASVEKAIEISGRQLFFFYAWQNAPGLGQLPGHGPINFQPWLQALERVNYRWYVNPFMHGHPEPDAMSAALRKAQSYLQQQMTGG
jgi:sugar phosphate isomerase/epimerase